jgi:hypothetical protein
MKWDNEIPSLDAILDNKATINRARPRLHGNLA